MLRPIRNLLREPGVPAGNADRKIELQSVVKQYNKNLHCSTKTTPVETSFKRNEETVYSIFSDKRGKNNPKNTLGQLDKTAVFEKSFQ